MRSIISRRISLYLAVGLLLLGLIWGITRVQANSKQETFDNITPTIDGSATKSLLSQPEPDSPTKQTSSGENVMISDNCTHDESEDTVDSDGSVHHSSNTTITCSDNGSTDVDFSQNTSQHVTSDDATDGTSSGASAHNESNISITIH